MDGRPLSGPAQLRNNQHYVAVGAEKFKALPYDNNSADGWYGQNICFW